MSNIKVGIVEDELIIAEGIVQAITDLGYTACEPVISYTEALEMIETEKPDILLLDIVLSGSKDGIDLAWKVKENYNIPFIFLSANSDPATVERAKKVGPHAYLVKPFNKEELYTAIEVCLYNFSIQQHEVAAIEKDNYIIKDCLFVKQGPKFIKVRRDEITYLESDRVYLTIYTTTGKFMVRSTLQYYLDLISSKNVVRVNRSYAVNLLHLEAISVDTVTVNGKDVPIGKTYREQLLNALQLG